MRIAKRIREKGVSWEVYPSAKGMKKQMKYANDRNIPFVIILGSQEIEKNTLAIKNMETGEQENIPTEEFLNRI